MNAGPRIPDEHPLVTVKGTVVFSVDGERYVRYDIGCARNGLIAVGPKAIISTVKGTDLHRSEALDILVRFADIPTKIANKLLDTAEEAARP